MEFVTLIEQFLLKKVFRNILTQIYTSSNEDNFQLAKKIETII